MKANPWHCTFAPTGKVSEKYPGKGEIWRCVCTGCPGMAFGGESSRWCNGDPFGVPGTPIDVELLRASGGKKKCCPPK